MNEADRDRIHELCSRIEVEQDRKIFLTLVEELNKILASTHRGLQEENPDNKKDG